MALVSSAERIAGRTRKPVRSKWKRSASVIAMVESSCGMECLMAVENGRPIGIGPEQLTKSSRKEYFEPSRVNSCGYGYVEHMALPMVYSARLYLCA